jgi:hypothetical protein
MFVNLRFFYFLFLLLGLSSCMVNREIRSLHIEVYKPGIFELPKDIKTIAIINRDLYHSDTSVFRYFDGSKKITDQSIKYRDISNRSVDALARFIKDQGYFQNVVNLRDSLDGAVRIQDRYSAEEYFKKSKADVCVFLNLFQPGNPIINYNRNLVYCEPSLCWSVEFKKDNLSYLYHQTDILNFFKSEFPKLYKKRLPIKPFINQATEDLSILFGARLIPTWQNVERMYYHSKNPDMQKAEKYALKNDWQKAAEIWKWESKNKNPEIAGKASFNMALVCEIEGKPDVAIDWLNKAKMFPIKDNEVLCSQYINNLSKRIKEIESLEKQFEH